MNDGRGGGGRRGTETPASPAKSSIITRSRRTLAAVRTLRGSSGAFAFAFAPLLRSLALARAFVALARALAPFRFRAPALPALRARSSALLSPARRDG